MKTLGLLCVFVLLSGMVVLLGAQAQELPNAPNIRVDKAFQDLLAKAQRSAQLRIDSNNVILSGYHDQTCVFMRTYRVKHEPGSDVVRPAGYTTCVPMSRFTMKTSVEIVNEPSN